MNGRIFMAKLNFSKAEAALSDSLHKMFIEDLYELASLAELISKGKSKEISNIELKKLFHRFQNELKKIKNVDPDFYAQLSLSESDEKKFFSALPNLSSEDWLKIQSFKEKISKWKKKLKGVIKDTKEDIEHIEKTRIKQKDARFKVNSKWLPL